MSTPGERQAIEMGKGSPVDFDCAGCKTLKARLAEAEALLRAYVTHYDRTHQPCKGIDRAACIRCATRKWLEGTGE